MVCIDRGYEDICGLRMLLDDVKREKVMYEGTSEATLVEFAGFLMKSSEGERSCEDKKYYCFLYQDFCLGQILVHDGNLKEQLKYYKIRKIILGNDLEQLSHYLNTSESFFEEE